MPGSDTAEPTTIEPTTQIATNPEQFQAAIIQLPKLEKFKELLFLRTTIENAEHTIVINRWDLIVDNDIKRIEIEQHKSLLIDSIRELTNNPTIVLRIHVDSTLNSQTNSGAYLTRDEKKLAMEVENPAFIELQKRFNTYMI